MDGSASGFAHLVVLERIEDCVKEMERVGGGDALIGVRRGDAEWRGFLELRC